jgi:hypothetical protein
MPAGASVLKVITDVDVTTVAVGAVWAHTTAAPVTEVPYREGRRVWKRVPYALYGLPE